jgi:hypothetical protein
MIWSFTLASARLAAVYWIARYECDFSASQSLFLTALAALAVEARYLRQSAAKRFQPFSLYIWPHYRDILTDAGLLAIERDANEREWQLLIKSQADGSIPWDGVTCFVLRHNFAANNHLIAWPESKNFRYSSRLTFPLGQLELEPLPLAAAFPAGCRAGNSRLKAGFWAQPGRAGLELTMRIDDKWWAARWAGTADTKPSFGESARSWEGTTNLTIAIIPYAELQCFYNWQPMQAGVSPKRRARAMEALGWHVDQSGGSYSHKYLTFAHGPIDR